MIQPDILQLPDIKVLPQTDIHSVTEELLKKIVHGFGLALLHEIKMMLCNPVKISTYSVDLMILFYLSVLSEYFSPHASGIYKQEHREFNICVA